MPGLTPGFGFGLGSIGVISFLTYLLNALGIATKGRQTASLPTESLAPDYTGTLVDYGGAVNSDSIDAAAVPGSRLVTTVAEGAVLGEDFYDPTAIPAGWTDNGDGTYTCDGTTGVGPYSSGESSNSYYFDVEITEITSGTYKNRAGTAYGVAHTTVGPITEEVIRTSTSAAYLYSSGFIGTVKVNSIKPSIPTIVDTDTSGNDLHPYTTVNGVKNYTFHPAHKVSTAYSAGDKVFTEASDGVRHYYSASSAGTTGATAPTFPLTGTVVDGDVTWTEEGLYTLRGQRVEGSSSQYLVNSYTPATQSTGVLTAGKYTLWIEDGDTGTATLSAGTATVTGSGDATDGSDLTFEVTADGTVDVTIAGTVSFFQLEGGIFRTSHITSGAAAVTRQANNIEIDTPSDLSAGGGFIYQVLTPIAGGQTGYTFSNYTDADNYVSIEVSPTVVTLNKRVSGTTYTAAKTFTHNKDEQLAISASYGSSGMAINVIIVGEAIGSSGTNADTKDAVLAATSQVGAMNDTNHFQATYDIALGAYSTGAKAEENAYWSL